MTNRVDPDEVQRIASLARIHLDDEHVVEFADQFANILGYFETLDSVPEVTDEPNLVNVMRDDEIRLGLSHDEALANASETEDGYFKGPRVS